MLSYKGLLQTFGLYQKVKISVKCNFTEIKHFPVLLLRECGGMSVLQRVLTNTYHNIMDNVVSSTLGMLVPAVWWWLYWCWFSRWAHAFSCNRTRITRTQCNYSHTCMKRSKLLKGCNLFYINNCWFYYLNITVVVNFLLVVYKLRTFGYINTKKTFYGTMYHITVFKSVHR